MKHNLMQVKARRVPPEQSQSHQLVLSQIFAMTTKLCGSGLELTLENLLVCCSKSLSPNWLPQLKFPTSVSGVRSLALSAITTLRRAQARQLPAEMKKVALLIGVPTLKLVVALVSINSVTGSATALTKENGLLFLMSHHKTLLMHVRSRFSSQVTSTEKS